MDPYGVHPVHITQWKTVVLEEVYLRDDQRVRDARQDTSAGTRREATEPQQRSPTVKTAVWNGRGEKRAIEALETNFMCLKNGLDDGVHCKE